MKFSQHLRQLGQPIAYYPQLAKPFGGVTAAVLFCQLFYWQDKTDNPLGVYKTQEDIENETGLSRREQETARKKLREIGVLIETHKRLEHRIYFKIDLDKLDELFDTLANAQNEPPPMAENDIRGVRIPPFDPTENTTENTNNNISLTRNINTHAKKSEALALLEQFGISEKLAKDFIVHRKAHKAPITATALQGFQREADKAGIPIQRAIEIAIERGWRGFRADWQWQDNIPAKNSRNQTAKPDAHSGFAERKYEEHIPDFYRKDNPNDQD